MNTLSNQELTRLRDDSGGKTICDYHIQMSDINNCVLNNVNTFTARTIVKNVAVENSYIGHNLVGPAIIDNCLFRDLQIYDLLLVWGAVFNEVRFEGNIGNVKINTCFNLDYYETPIEQEYDMDRQRFYQNIEWAIDISKAKCKLFEIKGIPAKLVRRDPETQAVVTHDLLKRTPGWEESLISSKNYWWPRISLFEGRTSDNDCLLVAPIGSSKTKRDKALKGLKELRALGLVLEE